jgi:guanylate kinase
MTTSRPLVLSGPSGVGKGTLIEMLRKAYPGTFSFCVSHTTRAPRPGETDGVSYHFTTKEAMQTQIDHGEFVEWARVHDNMYGTSKSSIRAALERGTPLLDIDVQGARSVHAQPDLNAVFVFVKPPSIEHLKQRLVGRSTESPEAIEKRVRNAVAEIEASNEPFWDRVFGKSRREKRDKWRIEKTKLIRHSFCKSMTICKSALRRCVCFLKPNLACHHHQKHRQQQQQHHRMFMLRIPNIIIRCEVDALDG